MTHSRARTPGHDTPAATPGHDTPAGAPGGGSPAGAHEWLSFEDRDEDRTWVFDLTFLTSRWSCVYGRGCQGVLTGPAPELEQGCCSYGAHFTGDEDVARVEAAAATLDASQWQFAARGRRRGPIRRDAGGTAVTRLVDGACIFLNRPGFPGGAGCALHRAALERDLLPLELKPDVCWQLPLRREESVDDAGHVTTTITQWDRRHWGAGGSAFHWWCTEAPEAFGGSEPVWKAMAAELVALVGPVPYLELTSYLRARPERSLLPHPAAVGDPGRSDPGTCAAARERSRSEPNGCASRSASSREPVPRR